MESTELTKELVSNSEVIAKGRRIRDLERLVHGYGGKPSMWRKMKSPPVDINGTMYEFHWYEHHGIRRFEIKKKRIQAP